MISFESLVRKKNLSRNSTHIAVQHSGLIDLEGVQLYRNLEYLDCSHNQLTKIPDLAGLTQLKIINLSHNRLRTLPRLPNMLRELHCSHNMLTEFPMDWSPRMLRQLNCGFNQIEVFPSFESFPLVVADIRFNRLKKLPGASPYLRVFLTDGNPLEPDDPDEVDDENETSGVATGDADLEEDRDS